MTTKLKAKDPLTVEPTKPKFIIFGAPGVGKTWFGLSFPNVYYIDCEGGASRSHYMDRLSKSGGKYLGVEDGSLDFETVIEQFKALTTEKHHFKTVIVDSVSKLFNNAVSTEAERLGDKNAFGADKKPAIAFMRRLVAATARLDMNVIFIAHEKSEWGTDAKGDRVEMGKMPDCWDKLIYELDLAFHAQKRGKSRVSVIKKTRLIGFPEGESFDLDFEKFAERYGKEIITKESNPVQLASADQVAEINRLVELLNIPKDTTDKWLEKASVEKIEEFNTEQADKIINNLKSKLQPK
jgi:hypothetical protein